MNVVDIVILLLLVLSAILGFRSGLIQCVFSLAGLIAGIAIASWNYKHFAPELAPTVHSMALAEAICFSLIALAVMLVAGLLGMLIKGLVHGIGLAWLDKSLGLIFGLLRGAVLVTLCIVILAAFYPDTSFLGKAALSRYFLGSAHLTTHMTPRELKDRIVYGLHVLEKDAPSWLEPKIDPK
jgi:membrane protein required for colicin V production